MELRNYYRLSIIVNTQKGEKLISPLGTLEYLFQSIHAVVAIVLMYFNLNLQWEICQL